MTPHHAISVERIFMNQLIEMAESGTLMMSQENKCKYYNAGNSMAQVFKT
jgi:hypothetical protein